LSFEKSKFSASMRRLSLPEQRKARELPWLSLITIPLLTAFTYWRLIDQGLAEHLFDYGTEGLNAVQA